MKIYIEFIYIINFLLDFMILFGTKKLLKKNTKIKRILLSSTIGSLTTYLLFIKINSVELFILKIIISIIMNLVAFGTKDLLKNTMYFYMISIIIGGSIYLLDIDNTLISIILLVITPPIIINLLIKEIKNYKLNYKDKYKVEIIIKNTKYNLEGFIDTGNHLKDPITKKSIILVDIDIQENKVIYIPYKALNHEGIIPCIKPEKIKINDTEIKNCLIGISKDKIKIPGCNCILPNILKEDLCLN